MGFSAEVNVGSRFLALRKSAFAKSGRSLGCGMLDGTAVSSEKARCVSRDADMVRGAWEAERPQGPRAFVAPLNLPLGL